MMRKNNWQVIPLKDEYREFAEPGYKKFTEQYFLIPIGRYAVVITTSQEPTFVQRQSNAPHDKIDLSTSHIKKEILEGKYQVATTNEGDNYMADYYKALIDRLDQDIRDHKQEMRDREAMYKADAKEREERHIKLLDEKFNAIDEKIRSQNELFQKQFEHINSHLLDIKNEMANVTSRVDTIQTRVDNVKWWILGSLITLLLGIAGIVYANWQVIGSMLQMVNSTFSFITDFFMNNK